MEISYNCSVLNNTFKILDTFSVNIYKDNINKNLFTELSGKRYDFEDFKVDHLRDYICDYICDRKNVAYSYKYAVKLWKVNVDVKVINEASTGKDLFKYEIMCFIAILELIVKT